MQVFTFPALDSLIFSRYGTVSWPPLLREAAYLLVVYDAAEALMMTTPAACVRYTSRTSPPCLRYRSPDPSRDAEHELFMTDPVPRSQQLKVTTRRRQPVTNAHFPHPRDSQ